MKSATQLLIAARKGRVAPDVSSRGDADTLCPTTPFARATVSWADPREHQILKPCDELGGPEATGDDIMYVRAAKWNATDAHGESCWKKSRLQLCTSRTPVFIRVFVEQLENSLSLRHEGNLVTVSRYVVHTDSRYPGFVATSHIHSCATLEGDSERLTRRGQKSDLF